MITKQQQHIIVGTLMQYDKYRFIPGAVVAEIVNDTVEFLNEEKKLLDGVDIPAE